MTLQPQRSKMETEKMEEAEKADKSIRKRKQASKRDE